MNAETPRKSRAKPAAPPPNLDLFGDSSFDQPPENVPGKTHERLGPVIRRLQLKLRSATDKALADEQLTTAQYGALSALERTPGLTSAEMARAAGVTAQTMHEIAKLLETRGWTEKQPEPGLGRRMPLQLTAAGRKALGNARRRVERIEEKLSAPLKPHERVLMQSLLERCIEGL